MSDNTNRILLVEDNPNNVLLARRALRNNNILNPLVVARDGQEALDYLFGMGSHAGRDTRDLPSVILLDLNLPKLDGLEVLRRIRADERTKLVPVIILTSSQEEVDLVKGYSLGANSYIRKPVNFVEFNEALGQLGEYWLGRNLAVSRRATK